MLLLVGLLSNTFAEEIVVTQSGQRILLKDNGQWELVSNHSDTDTGTVLAKVNGVSIRSDSFIQAAIRTVPKDGKNLDLEERREVLEKLIDDELLFQKAYQEGLFFDTKVQKVMTNTLLRDNVYNQIKDTDFSEQDMQNYFYSNQNDFIIPAKVQIYNIHIKVTPEQTDSMAQNKAEQIYSRLLKNPDNFKEIAATESEGAYKRRGGDVGFVSQDGKPGLDPLIVEKAFSMPVKTLSTPFRTQDGWNIIYVPTKRKQIQRSYEAMKGSVLRTLKNERLLNAYKDYTYDIKSTAQIQIDQSALQNIDIDSSSNLPTLPKP